MSNIYDDATPRLPRELAVAPSPNEGSQAIRIFHRIPYYGNVMRSDNGDAAPAVTVHHSC